tara:strand:- start:3532 stop:5724 length:2193 start_codon:yes stop_codon:yes gene_type:complete
MKDQVINNLFDKDDYIILKNIKELENGKVTFFGFPGSRSTAINVNDFSFYCVNAIKLDSDDKATNHNIATYRNFVIENDSLTKDQQLDIIERSGLPISNQVFSGNSSVHNTICLDVPLKDEETYRTWFKAITKGLSKWGYTADEACINPSRLTRMPLATHANGSEQSIISVGNRVTHNAMLDWFITNDIDLDELEVKKFDQVTLQGDDDANDDERWEAVKRILFTHENLDYSNLSNGEREPVRFRIILMAKACGLSADATFNYMSREFPSSKGEQKLRDGIDRAWIRDVERKHITSTETWRAQQALRDKEDYIKKNEALLTKEYSFNEIEDEVIDADYDNELHRYMLIANDIYMLVNRQLKPVTLQRFTINHTKVALRTVNRYVDFITEPGYINFQPIINQHYNKFNLPTWRAKKGEWSTIEQYLRHVAGDQYDMMLDYLQISLINPKQKLPILILMSYEKNTGKTTFLELLKALFGNNIASPTPKQFELEWNSHWVNEHFIFIDEAERIEKKEDVASKLKRLCYAMTAEHIRKGKNTDYIPFNGRFVITSNQASGFIEIDEQDDRWWILNVPKRKGEFDNQYYDKIKAEISFFAHYLMNRQLSTDNVGRGWFAPELLKTKALEAVIAINKPKIETDVSQWFTEWFETHETREECNFLIGDVQSKLMGYSDIDLKAALHKVFGVFPGSRRTKEDSFVDFQKRQKCWITIPRSAVTTISDINNAMADAFTL